MTTKGRNVTHAERLYAILDNLVNYDLRDVKSDIAQEAICNARQLALELFREEIKDYATSLVETLPHQEAAQ